MSWFKLAEHPNELNFNDAGLAVTKAGGKKICVGKFEEKIFAFAFSCPHAGGVMADGYIDAMGNVVCPLHRYKFSMENGRNVSGEGYFLKTYPVEEREDGWWVEVKPGFLL
jgi:nitrite reductase/ring-hydroxylating ferredoxin subunit